MLRAECSQHDASRSARKRGTCMALIIKVHGRYYRDAHRLPDGRTVAKNGRRRPADSGRKTVRRSTTTGVQGISPFSEDSYSLGLCIRVVNVIRSAPRTCTSHKKLPESGLPQPDPRWSQIPICRCFCHRRRPCRARTCDAVQGHAASSWRRLPTRRAPQGSGSFCAMRPDRRDRPERCV